MGVRHCFEDGPDLLGYQLVVDLDEACIGALLALPFVLLAPESKFNHEC